MGRYTEADLREIAKFEPERAYYLRHEEQFLEWGIDLTVDNWDSVLQTSMAPMPGENRYAFFLRCLNDEDGIVVMDDKNVLRHVGTFGRDVNQIVAKEVSDSDIELQQFSEEPPIKPEPLKRPAHPSRPLFSMFLRAVTFGSYKSAAYTRYEQEMLQYDYDMNNYDAHKDDYPDLLKDYEANLERYQQRKAAFDRRQLESERPVTLYNSVLAERGKTPEMQQAYREAMKKHVDEIEAEEKKFSDLHEHTENTFTDISKGKERLDFIFGPRVSEEKTAEMQKKCMADAIFEAKNFGLAEKKDESEILKGYDMPKDCPFSAHQMALLGYSATCNLDVILRTHPNPESLSDNNKYERESLWYNWIDGIVARSPRAAAGSVPMINAANADALEAVEKYMAGDPTKLAKVIIDGLRRSVDQATMQGLITEDSTFADYGHLCGELLEFVNKDKYPELYTALVDSGLTSKDIQNAKTCNSTAKIWDAGLEAIRLLSSDADLTQEQKLSAAADIAGMRFVSQMMMQRYNEMEESKEYKEMLDEFTSKVAIAAAEDGAASSELRAAETAKNKSEAEMQKLRDNYERCHNAFGEINGAFASLSCGFVAAQFGVDTMPNDAMRGMFGADSRPEEVHNLFARSESIRQLSERPKFEICSELSQKTAGKYIQTSMPRKSVAAPAANPSLQKQANVGRAL